MTLLPLRRLPGLGREVSVVGAGCWPLGGPASNNGKPIGWGPVDDQQAQQTLSFDDRKGSLEPGMDADIVIMDADVNVRLTMARGQVVYRADDY